MIAALALLPSLCLASIPVAQDAAPAPAKRWTQEELERVSGEIRTELETMRGMKFKRPVKVHVTDKKGFLEYARKRQERDDSPERQKRDETIAKMLGAVPPDIDLQATLEKLLEEQVGGFYDPGSDAFYLMESYGGDIARIILAHELTHALDDQYFDLDANLKRLHEETDAEFALRAVAEGSGTNAMYQWTVQHKDDLDMSSLLESGDLETRGLEAAPAFLWVPLIAVYLRGEGFLVHTAGMNIAMKAAKTDDVRRAFEHPPRSSEQILHPEKYWDASSLDEPRSVAIDASKLPLGWKTGGEDTLGELYLALVTTPSDERPKFDPKNPFGVLAIHFTNKAAEGWGGDRALLLEKGDARVLWLVTTWDTPKDAGEFRDAATTVFQDKPGTVFRHRVDRDGDSDVVVVVSYAGVAEADLPKPTWKVAPKKP